MRERHVQVFAVIQYANCSPALPLSNSLLHSEMLYYIRRSCKQFSHL